jgi:hypothetical protein
MLADLDAERAVLGSLLQFPEFFSRVSWLTPDMFTQPRHKGILPAIRESSRLDRVEIPDRLGVLDELRKAGALTRDPGLGVYLAELTSLDASPQPLNIRWYAHKVLDAYRRRELVAMSERLIQACETSDTDDLASFSAELANVAADLTAPVDDAKQAVRGLYEMGAFVDARKPERDWVIPNLLARGERVIVVATEGAGKTMLARAIAIGCASGVHPFDVRVPIPPVRTLLADLENPEDIIQETSGPLVGMMRHRNIWTAGNCHILHRPGGLDLRKATDQRELERAIQQTTPDIICLGPIYKTFGAGAGEKEENAARDVAMYFDRLRERYGVAFWLEHHAPLEQNGNRAMRPIGTSLWQRWPEFGVGLRKVESEQGVKMPGLVVDHWRGQRSRGREWPDQLWPDSPDGWAWRAHWDSDPSWMKFARAQSGAAS